MGNHTSSCFHISLSKPKTAKLMDFKGNFTRIKLPLKSAELMLEHPGFVLSPLHDILRTGRLIALRAQDDLLPSKIYLLVPLTSVNHKVSESQMRIIQSVSVKFSRKRLRGAKVLPAVEIGVETGSESELLEKDNGISGCRLEKFGHWTPVLDPILEEREEL